MKSSFPQNASLYRASSKGRIFSRRERESLIENEKLAKQYAAGIQEEREKIKTEKRNRAARFRILHAMADNPGEKIKRKKDGTAFIQRRVNGKFQPATVIV